MLDLHFAGYFYALQKHITQPQKRSRKKICAKIFVGVFESLVNYKSWVIVKRVEWSWSLSDAFVTFLWTRRCTTFSIPIILFLLTNINAALIYSITICGQVTNDCAPLQGASNINSITILSLMFVAFHNHYPLLTMA